jgi:hypothetical protein
MASTFGGVLAVSRRSLWTTEFTKVEEIIGKAEIMLGEKIIRKNLQDEIDLSPMNEEVMRRMLVLMMDGGWDQHASGKAYIVPLDVMCLLEQERGKSAV